MTLKSQKSIRSKGESSSVNEYEKAEKKVEEESKEAKGESKSKSNKEESKKLKLVIA